MLSGAGTAYRSGAPEFTPVLSEIRVTRSLVLCVCFVDLVCPFVLFLLSIVLFVLRFTGSDYLPWYLQTLLTMAAPNTNMTVVIFVT